jgi:hypothetical protein
MRISWLYSIPTWVSGTLTVVAFVGFGLAGLYLTRGWVRLPLDPSTPRP